MRSTGPEPVRVAAGAIVRNDEVLLSCRPKHLHQGGLWEFPGGKLEAGESATEALVRELREELAITPSEFRPLIQIPWSYPDLSVVLEVFLVTAFQGVPRAMEKQQFRWVRLNALVDYRFPAANRPVLKALDLPDLCAITPDLSRPLTSLQGYADGLKNRNIRLVYARSSNPDSGLYREQAEALATALGEDCRLVARPCVVSGSDKFAGIHLDSRTLMSTEYGSLNCRALVSASCHDEEEVEHANALGVDFVFISPVKKTASHPGTKPIGWDCFARLAQLARCPVYALGGLTEEDRKKVWQSGGQGVAALSVFSD